jgi:hypothetical protein
MYPARRMVPFDCAKYTRTFDKPSDLDTEFSKSYKLLMSCRMIQNARAVTNLSRKLLAVSVSHAIGLGNS